MTCLARSGSAVDAPTRISSARRRASPKADSPQRLVDRTRAAQAAPIEDQLARTPGCDRWHRRQLGQCRAVASSGPGEGEVRVIRALLRLEAGAGALRLDDGRQRDRLHLAGPKAKPDDARQPAAFEHAHIAKLQLKRL